MGEALRRFPGYAAFGALDVGLKPLKAAQMQQIDGIVRDIADQVILNGTYDTRTLVIAIRLAFDRLVQTKGADLALARITTANVAVRLVESAKLDLRGPVLDLGATRAQRLMVQQRRAAALLKLLRE
jgi:hypothetical protein